MKKCYKCLEIKPFDSFHKRKSAPDGKQYACIECRKKMGEEYFSREYVKEKRRHDQIEWRLKNPLVARDSYKRWYSKNRIKAMELHRLWATRNPTRGQINSKKRMEAIKRATPSWFEKNKVAGKYKTAKRLSELTGIPHSVDHIIPLRSPIVCGLHCNDNLRVITLEDNMRKLNKLQVPQAGMRG